MPKGDKEKRIPAILMRLLKDGRVSTHDLSAGFNVTEVAIRGDFEEVIELLRLRGLHVHRFYGGIELEQQSIQPYRGFYETQSKAETDAAHLLSEYVVRNFVKWDDSLLLDTGRTLDAVAYQIAAQQKSGLRIMTNSFTPNVLGLYAQGGIEMVQLGGTPLMRTFCYVKCPGGDEFYQPYWSGPFKAVMTGSGFQTDSGLLVNHPDIIDMKRRFIKAASEVILILSHDRFQKTARDTVTFCGLKPDPWLVEYAAQHRTPGVGQDREAVPLTIVTDLPPGKHPEDIPLSRHIPCQTDGKICLFKTRLPLVA
ncbi:MAG: DeoR/GlpR transcriptional regulator [candidate division Zixibacteria bacterium]|nr:DeoR/GlpR transcriptional regulator [candidate division Zixibacteria bacterium]